MTETAAQYLSLPFEEAISFFAGKVNLPTDRWDDLWGAMHSQAFVVAGAAKTELLCDLRAAVDKAIAQGTTLAEFRKDFDTIVDRHGWKYNGNRGWRTSVIYGTNLSMAYSAGRYKGMTDPAVLAVRPYWWYLPSGSLNKREDHKPFYNLVLRWDHPFWETHDPPNGWGCKCSKRSLSSGELERYRSRYGLKSEAPELGTYTYTNKKTGEQIAVPVGIDPGFDYSPGRTSWGQQLSSSKMNEYLAGAASWKSLTPGDWQSFGLAEQLTAAEPVAAIGQTAGSRDEVAAVLSQIIGDEQVYSFTSGGFRYDLLVNAETLADHLDLAAVPYLPLIPETLTDPQEVWLQFLQHSETGEVALQMRVVKVVATDQGTCAVVCGVKNGWIESWTLVPVDGTGFINTQRDGWLAYRKQ